MLACLLLALSAPRLGASSVGPTSCESDGVELPEELQAYDCLLQKSTEKFTAEEERALPFLDYADQWKQAAGIVQGLPGFEGLKNIVESARGAIEGTALSSLTTAERAINTTLEALDSQAEEIQTLADNSFEDVADGVASMLARRMGISSDIVPISSEVEQRALPAVAHAAALWGNFRDSLQSATIVLTKGLSGIGLTDVGNGFNASIQTVLASAAELSHPLVSAQDLLSGHEGRVGSTIGLAAVKDWMDELTVEIEVAHRKAKAFPDTCQNSVNALDDRVNDIATKFGPDVAAQANIVLKRAGGQADAIARKLTRGTLQLVDGVGKGIATASQPMRAMGQVLQINTLVVFASIFLLMSS